MQGNFQVELVDGHIETLANGTEIGEKGTNYIYQVLLRRSLGLENETAIIRLSVGKKAWMHAFDM